MKKLSKACKDLVEEGFAENISGEAIRFTGDVDRNKLVEVERSYATAVYSVGLTAPPRSERRKRNTMTLLLPTSEYSSSANTTQISSAEDISA